jgi:cytochrome b involved in lipid metabolism
MNIKTLAVICMLVLFGIGAYIVADTSSDQSQPTTTDASQIMSDQVAVAAPEESYTEEEVAQHTSGDDCWTIIGDSVYDITSYIPRHPGGSEILLACGVDGSSLFNQRQDEKGNAIGSGTPHGSNAADQLAKLLIGSLQQ